MKITYKDKEIELKYSFRALMIYENVVNKSFSPQSLTDIITFFYCVAISNLKEDTIDFDEFVDWLDDNPGILNDFTQWLLESVNANEAKTKKTPAPKGSKKTKNEDPN